MNIDQGTPLKGCTAWISPIYLERYRSDVPIGGTIYLSYEPFSKESSELSRDSKAIYSPYEFEGLLIELLKSWIGIHDVVSDDYGIIVVTLRPIIAQYPVVRYLMWQRLKNYLVAQGAELVPYTQHDKGLHESAYEIWAKKEE